MKNQLTIFILAFLGLTACSEKPVKAVPGNFKEGQLIFNKVCGTCHGTDLKGNSAVPALIDNRFLPDHFPDEKIRSTIVNGSESRVMRPQRSNVSDSEIEEIIKYIRYSQVNNPQKEDSNQN